MLFALMPGETMAQCTVARCGPPNSSSNVIFLVPEEFAARPDIVAALTTRQVADAPHIKFNVMPYRDRDEMDRLGREAVRRSDLGALGVLVGEDQVDIIMRSFGLDAQSKKFPMAIVQFGSEPSRELTQVLDVKQFPAPAQEAQLTDSTRVFRGEISSTTAFAVNKYLMSWWQTRK